jgi:hypothetical protein
MGRIGPTFILPLGQHPDGEEPMIKDIGGMLHKAVQLVGDMEGVRVEVLGSIDPALKPPTDIQPRVIYTKPPVWTPIAMLTAAEPYKHHTGWVRWIRVLVLEAPKEAVFGVAGMGED